MNKKVTERGFIYYEFEDSLGIKCTLQESSSAIEPKIWLGAEEIGLKRFTPENKWEDITLNSTDQVQYIANNRMHLTRQQVTDLLPILQIFVDTGTINSYPKNENGDDVNEQLLSSS